MQDDTREKLLNAAKRQFAEKGFYGTSIAQIAGEVGLTKQALLYHFKRKEDLYAEIIQEISQRFLRFVRAAVQRQDTPERQLENILMGIYSSVRESPLDTQLLARELLDNQARAEKAKDWYLLPFLAEIVAVVQRIKGFENTSFSEAFCIVYQFLGSIEYFAISTTTLQRMYGPEAYEDYSRDFPIELRNQIQRLIESRNPVDSTTV